MSRIQRRSVQDSSVRPTDSAVEPEVGVDLGAGVEASAGVEAGEHVAVSVVADVEMEF